MEPLTIAALVAAIPMMEAQQAIGIGMIHRSGIPADAEEAEAVRMTIADERVTKGE